MKIFLDTNVLVGAYLWNNGVCAKVMRQVLSRYELISGEVIIQECREVLFNKFGCDAEFVDRVEYELRRHHIEPFPVSLLQIDIRDKDDKLVLASAINSGSDILVSGDKDLLVLGNAIDDIKIISPGLFLRSLTR